MTNQLIGLLIIVQCVFGQQTQDRISYSQIYGIDDNIQTIVLPTVNQEALMEEDYYRESGTPYRYGFKHKVHFTPENSGTWRKTIDGGEIWQIRLFSEGAYAISLEYEDFFIPERFYRKLGNI